MIIKIYINFEMMEFLRFKYWFIEVKCFLLDDLEMLFFYFNIVMIISVFCYLSNYSMDL